MASKHHPNNYRIIGVAGAGHGTGVTHFSVMMANFTHGVWQKRTAVLEWNDHGDFARMETVCAGKSAKTKPYRVQEVDFYKNSGTKELLECTGSGYEIIIIDFGLWSEKNSQEFARCDRRLLLGAFSEWQIEAFLETIKMSGLADKGRSCFAAFGSEEPGKTIKKKLKTPIHRVPFSVDAFTVNYEIITFFEKIL